MHSISKYLSCNKQLGKKRLRNLKKWLWVVGRNEHWTVVHKYSLTSFYFNERSLTLKTFQPWWYHANQFLVDIQFWIL